MLLLIHLLFQASNRDLSDVAIELMSFVEICFKLTILIIFFKYLIDTFDSDDDEEHERKKRSQPVITFKKRQHSHLHMNVLMNKIQECVYIGDQNGDFTDIIDQLKHHGIFGKYITLAQNSQFQKLPVVQSMYDGGYLEAYRDGSSFSNSLKQCIHSKLPSSRHS